MTMLGLPSHSAPLQANYAAANAPLSERGAAGANGAPDSSAFDAVLNSLDDSGNPTQPPDQPATGNVPDGAPAAPPAEAVDAALSAAKSWRSVHSLGSGVLVVLDKRLDPGAAEAPSRPLKAEADNGADASALANIGWASLIGGLTGAAGSPAPASTAPGSASATPLPSAAALAALTAARAGAGETMPSDGATLATHAAAVKAPPPPIAVKVERSITYLGLDPTAPHLQASAGAQTRSAAKGPLDAASLRGEGDSNALAALSKAQGGSSAMASGDQAQQNARGSGANGTASAKAPPSDQDAATVSGQAAKAAGLSGVMQGGGAAMSANNLTLVPFDQLADFVANAAEGLDAQIDAGQSSATANGADAARMSPVKELDVQLNPASLGALSIQMRLSDGNLNVTIKADKPDTLKLIENERTSIADKLKSLNFSVESLTVKASEAVASRSAGADASNTGTSGYGEAQQGQSGQTAAGSHNGRSLAGGGDQRQQARQDRETMAEPGGDNNFGHLVI